MANLIQSSPYNKWVASLGDIIYDNLYSNSNRKPEITSVAYTPSADSNSGDVEVHINPNVISSWIPYTASGVISGYYNNLNNAEAHLDKDSLIIDSLKDFNPQNIEKIIFKSEEYVKVVHCYRCLYSRKDGESYFCNKDKMWGTKNHYCGQGKLR